jgi:hypothetical protein
MPDESQPKSADDRQWLCWELAGSQKTPGEFQSSSMIVYDIW